MIRAPQRIGLTIAEIRGELDALPPGQVPDAQDRPRLAAHLRNVLNRRIDE